MLHGVLTCMPRSARLENALLHAACSALMPAEVCKAPFYLLHAAVSGCMARCGVFIIVRLL